MAVRRYLQRYRSKEGSIGTISSLSLVSMEVKGVPMMVYLYVNAVSLPVILSLFFWYRYKFCLSLLQKVLKKLSSFCYLFFLNFPKVFLSSLKSMVTYFLIISRLLLAKEVYRLIFCGLGWLWNGSSINFIFTG